MSYRIILALSLALASALALAEPEPPVASDAPNTMLPPVKQTEEQKQMEAHCKSLQRKVQELKNRPLRRSAAADRYRLECQDPPHGGLR